MNAPMIAATLDQIPPPQPGKPSMWSEDDLAAFVELLSERPALLSPEQCRARSTARGHAEKLRHLLALRGVRVRVRVWCEQGETDADRGVPPAVYRWAVIRQQESTQ